MYTSCLASPQAFCVLLEGSSWRRSSVSPALSRGSSCSHLLVPDTDLCMQSFPVPQHPAWNGPDSPEKFWALCLPSRGSACRTGKGIYIPAAHTKYAWITYNFVLQWLLATIAWEFLTNVCDPPRLFRIYHHLQVYINAACKPFNSFSRQLQEPTFHVAVYSPTQKIFLQWKL